MAAERVRAVVVDDTELNNRIYAKLLEKAGVTESLAFTASSAALGWCSEHDAALVVLDYNMAAPDGLAFIELLRGMQHQRETPVLMITGDADRAVRYRALDLGVSDFLTKPVDPPEIIARARNLLALRESRRAVALQAAHLADQSTWLASEVRRVTRSLRDRERDTICGLTRAAEFRDSETGMHIVRIGLLSAEVGKSYGLPDDDLDLLQLAAPMHDIGKVATPDSILLKEGPLTQAEWRIMREHPVAGYQILKDSSSELLRRGAEIALSHHEKFDGSGYPHGVSGEAIPLWGAISSICDVFDALTSARPYKPAWSLDSAVTHIAAQRGAHFDPRLVSAFLDAVPAILEIKRRYGDAA